MKKLYFAIFALIAGNAFCQTTVDFENFNLNGSESFFDGSDLSGTSNGAGTLTSYYSEGLLQFTTVYDTSWGASSGYWSDGWVFTNETLDNLTGYAGLTSSYAGGGDLSSNYVIGQNGSVITKTNDFVSFQSMRITNNNYAASSMLSGDAFAKKFGGASGDDPDWFLLSIVGYDAGDVAIGTVDFYLADFRFSDNNQDYIIKDWTTVDLTAVENASYLVFKLSSTDSTGGYMNTPAFFAMDKIMHSSAIGVEENINNDFVVYPNPTHNVINHNSELFFTEVIITNVQGQIVKSFNNMGSQSGIDVSDLKAGFYHVTFITEEGAMTKKFQKI